MAQLSPATLTAKIQDRPLCLQEARHQLRQQGGKQHVKLAVAATAAVDVPALKLPFQPLSFAAASVLFWATMRRLVLCLPAVAGLIEPCAGTNVPWLGCWAGLTLRSAAQSK